MLLLHHGMQNFYLVAPFFAQHTGANCQFIKSMHLSSASVWILVTSGGKVCRWATLKAVPRLYLPNKCSLDDRASLEIGSPNLQITRVDSRLPIAGGPPPAQVSGTKVQIRSNHCSWCSSTDQNFFDPASLNCWDPYLGNRISLACTLQRSLFKVTRLQEWGLSQIVRLLACLKKTVKC